jgi:uncharacterized protein YqeY
MTTLTKQVHTDMIEALKAGQKTKKMILAGLLSRAAIIAKNDKDRVATDNDLINAAQKIIKEARETIDFAIKGGRDVSGLQFEIETISKYLPSRLTNEELLAIILSYNTYAPPGTSAKGYIMKSLGENYKGQYDSKEAIAGIEKVLAS